MIDVSTTLKVVLLFVTLAAIVLLVTAVRSIKSGKKLLFYQKRQVLIYRGWRLILLALLLLGSGFLISRFGEPVVYRYFPPSPSITLTPTITPTPTITLTPSSTFTPTITLTLSQTYTPALPQFIQETVQTPIGPDVNAVFSPLNFAEETDEGVVVDSFTEFSLPVATIFGGFSYDRMTTGVQWTAVWLYGEEVVCSETKAWDYAPGGYGYTDCTLPPEDWKPGRYEVQIYVGLTWKVSGEFFILAESDSTGYLPPESKSGPALIATPTPPPG
jgi:hypothetical protein